MPLVTSATSGGIHVEGSQLRARIGTLSTSTLGDVRRQRRRRHELHLYSWYEPMTNWPAEAVNRLRDAGLQSRRPFKGLVLTLRHQQERLRWVRRHIRMTRADWGRVLFTDESKFNRYKRDGIFLFLRSSHFVRIQRNWFYIRYLN